MNNIEKLLCLCGRFMILSINKERNAQELEKIFKDITALKRESNIYNKPEVDNAISIYGYVKFTDKEILQMPINFRKVLRTDGSLVQACKTMKEKIISFELHYRRNEYNIYANGNDLETAKQKFIKCTQFTEI